MARNMLNKLRNVALVATGLYVALSPLATSLSNVINSRKESALEQAVSHSAHSIDSAHNARPNYISHTTRPVYSIQPNQAGYHQVSSPQKEIPTLKSGTMKKTIGKEKQEKEQDKYLGIIKKSISKIKSEGVTLSESVSDVYFLRAVIKKESDDERVKISRCGARGAMQVMPCVWKEVHGTLDNYYEQSINNTELNIYTAIKFFDILEDKYLKEDCYPSWKSMPIKQRQKRILAAYNGGPTRFKARGFQMSQMPSETRYYIDGVMQEKDKIKKLGK